MFERSMLISRCHVECRPGGMPTEPTSSGKARRRLIRAVAFVGLCSCLQPSANAADTISRFIERLYAPYREGGQPIGLHGKRAAQILTPSLRSLIRENVEANAGEVSAPGMDPICVCQDYDRIALHEVKIVSESGARASVIATFSDLGEQREVRFVLQKIGGRWLIDDLRYDESMGLRQQIEAETRILKNADHLKVKRCD